MYNSIKSAKQNDFFLFEEKLKHSLELCPTNLDSYFKEFLFTDAKRLRPLFAFLLCDLTGAKTDDDVINLALAAELLHSASLIHDDILDDAEMRRGKTPIHADCGIKTAVLAGDYLLSLAMQFISKLNNSKILNIMSEASYKMVKSELYSLSKRHQTQDLKEYLLCLEEKTASLFMGISESIFELKNVKKDENIIKFARNFALCFQIRDDINNFLNLDKNKISSDVKEGVFTLPCILDNNPKKAEMFLEDLILETKNCLSEYKNKNDLIFLLDSFKGKA